MEFDLLIRNATVMPGEGPALVADVGVRAGTIAAVGGGLAGTAREVIDATGLMLCPGFIDLHAHSALEPFRDPVLEPKIAQGFTTEVINPDGLAPAPVDPARAEARRLYLQPLEGPGPEPWPWTTGEEYAAALEAARPATDLVLSVGHNAVRDHVMGSANRHPSPEEIRAMRREVRRGLEAGARALSFGLIYLPGLFAGTDELVALAEEAAAFGVPLVPHVRNEGAGVVDAVGEMIEVARRSGASLHISHLKVIGDERLVEPLLALIDRASQEVDLTFDQYPYGAGSTMLSALLPPWAQEGGAEAILGRLADPGQRARMAEDVRDGLRSWENIYASCGPENIVIVQAAGDAARHVGRSLAEVAEDLRRDPFEAALDLMAQTSLDVAMVDHYASEATTRAIFRHRLALVGSDGIFGPRPHPRLYGTAARVLGRFALRERLVPVEEAVARLSARAARRARLDDRGRIEVGLRADLVLLDPERFVDVATYDDPCLSPPGVRLVTVAGEAVYRDGRPTGARPGRVVLPQVSR